MKTITKILKSFFSLLCIVCLLMACSKDGNDGAVGPRGEQGPAGLSGADGQEGVEGAQGEQGETGTANVIYSDWISVDFETGVAAETNEQLITSFSPGEFSLTEDILLVYGRHEVNAIVMEIHQLPYVLAAQSEYYGFKVSSFSGGSSLRIQASTLDDGTNLFTYFDDFRYIIIPGGVSTSGKSSSSINYSKMTYEEIVDHFNIPE